MISIIVENVLLTLVSQVLHSDITFYVLTLLALISVKYCMLVIACFFFRWNTADYLQCLSVYHRWIGHLILQYRFIKVPILLKHCKYASYLDATTNVSLVVMVISYHG